MIIKNAGEIVLLVAGTYAAIYRFLKRRQNRAEPMKHRPLLMLWIIMLAVLLLKVSEDVIAVESRLIDKAVFTWIPSKRSLSLD